MSLETQVRRPTETCVTALLRELGKVVGLYCRKSAAAVNLRPPQLFILWRSVNMPSESNLKLSKAEIQMIALIRSLDYGEVRIMVKDKKPIRVEEIRRSIQLTSEK